MKKRFLSLFLALALLLTGIPMATAAGSGFAGETAPQVLEDGGPVKLPVDTLEESQGFAQADPDQPETAEPKIVHDASDRFSETGAAAQPAAEDLVNFVVVMKDRSLLAAGFSAEDIAAQTASVASYQSKQLAGIESLKTSLTKRFGEDEGFQLGFTYTIGTTGLSVTTQYGNKAALETMPGVDYVYVAPTFQLPEDYSLDTGDTYQPMTNNATTMIGADVVNETGFTGKGMKIAILDTGIVVNHPSFAALPEDKLTEDSMTQESVDAIWDTLNASQTYFRNSSYYNSKLPFIFNYDGLNFDVSHATAGHDHGTHVAGIAAANKTDSTSVVGVAPDAQLVVMQVFSRGGGANWTTILAALEDCVRLDVDAANLSLGSGAGFTTSGDKAMLEVLNRFAETDIEILIAAGNDTNNAYMNLTGLNMSKAGNPDTGLVGTPSTYHTALSVASVENDGADQLYFTVNDRQIGYVDTAVTAMVKFLRNFQDQTLEFVVVPGYGVMSDYEGLDVTGKVAVVSRGGGSEATFPVKQAAAQAAGAIACVVYNNVPGVLNMQINDFQGAIPCISISQADGLFLKELGTGSLKVCNGDLIRVKMDRMVSDFSSWGVAPDLTLKPEIAGVGGGIYSSRDPSIAGSSYGSMSGTSMATPQVTGAMAVLVQYLRSSYDYTEAELRQVAANLMMSTANPVMFDQDREYSPRAQGAGLVDLVKATTSQAYLTSREVQEGRPKGQFGDDDEKTGVYEFGFEINNMSSEQDLTYTFDSSVLTESLYNGAYIQGVPYGLDANVEIFRGVVSNVMKYDFNDDGVITTADARVLLRHLNGKEPLADGNLHLAYVDVNGDGKQDMADVDMILAYCAELEVPVDLLAKAEVTEEDAVTQVTVAAGETVALTARITLADGDKQYMDDSFPNGMFVEGFLYAKSSEEDGVDLSMPFVGFYGNWSDAPVFDEPDETEASLYPRRVFTNRAMIGTNPYLRGGKAGDQYNAFSYANPLAEMDFGMLRNAKKMTFTVTDKETGEVYWTLSGQYLTKSFYNTSYGMIIPFFVVADDGEVWNGMNAKGEKLPDGTHVVYSVQAWLDDGDDVMDDEFSFEITLDTEKPVVENQYTLQEDLKLDETNGRVILPLTLKDNQHIAAILFVDPDGIIMGKYEVNNVPGEPYTAEYDITGYGTDFKIVVADYACNEFEMDASLDLGSLSNQLPARKELSKDRLYGCETFSGAAVESGWFSANRADFSDARNETFDSAGRYYSAEYVNGYLIAQSAITNDLVLVTPASTHWRSTTLVSQNGAAVGQAGMWVLYDMALDYSDRGSEAHDPYEYAAGKDTLYAVGWKYAGDNNNDGKDDGYNALFRIWMSRWNGSMFVDEIAPITGTQDGSEILTLGCTTEGDLYGIDTNAKLYSVGRDGVCSYIGTTDFVNANNYSGANVIQSMGYDHNTDTMYWYAHSQTPNGQQYLNICMTYQVDLTTGRCTEVGTYGPGGQTCLFVPTDMTSDLFTMGVDPTGFSISPYDLTMATGQRKRMEANWQPWNATPAKVTWASSDESVVTINDAGFVTAVAEGEATITGKATIWDAWAGDWDPETGAYPGAWVENTQTAHVRVVGSADAIYGFIIEDFNNIDNRSTWVTFSDQAPGRITVLKKEQVLAEDAEGQVTMQNVTWQGGAYYNGYVYTATMEQWPVGDNTVATGTVLYRSKVTKGETPDKTVIGERERVGATANVELGNLGFDYNTGRMYAVDYTNGGMAIVDLDSGAVDLLGTFSGDIGGPTYATAMCVTREGRIIISDMSGNLYTVDCDTLYTTRIGSCGTETLYYAGMTYDYNTDNIYWNPCYSAGMSPLYLVRVDPDEWEPDRLRATIVDIGDVASKDGVEMTAMFTIPENEPETKRISVEGIEITNGDSALGLVGGQLQLNTQTTPQRPTVRTRTWSTSDPSVVTVDGFGVMTFQGVGTAEVTVSITNKDPETEGGPFTDTIQVEVLEAGGELIGFIGYDMGGSSYYDSWATFYDYAITAGKPGDFKIDVYSIRSGEYYDGYIYGYDNRGDFYRIDESDHNDFVRLGDSGLDSASDKVSNMAFDYTTGTMYALTLSGYLATVDLDTGVVTKLVRVDKKVSALAVDKDGVLYTAGSESISSDGCLYTLDPVTGACTLVLTLEKARIGTGDNVYGQYCPQMTYDFTTNRLYLNATYYMSHYHLPVNFYMIQLGEEISYVNLGQPALKCEGVSTRIGDMYLGLLCAIPEDDEIPVGKVNGILLNQTATRIAVDGSVQLEAKVRPSNAANQSVTWTSSDPAVATVDANGLVKGLTAGTAVITATSEETGVTASCKVTVLSLEGPQSLAYTVSGDRESLVAFNPAMPGPTAEIVANLSGGSNIAGVAVGDDCLYYVDKSGSWPVLYSFDFVTKQSTRMGALECMLPDVSDIAYDPATGYLYLGTGYYVFQYDVTRMKPEGLNTYVSMREIINNNQVNTVACVDGYLYALAKGSYGAVLYRFSTTDPSPAWEQVVVMSLDTAAKRSEMDYDSSTGLFYITDAMDNLFTFDLEGNVTEVGKLSDGWDLNGLAIVPATEPEAP